jgi:hypothetical protein
MALFKPFLIPVIIKIIIKKKCLSIDGYADIEVHHYPSENVQCPAERIEVLR